MMLTACLQFYLGKYFQQSLIKTVLLEPDGEE